MENKEEEDKENINDENKDIKIKKECDTKYLINGDVIINEKIEAKRIKKRNLHILKIC